MENDRKAIVLGASSGIGKEIALLLAKEGWRVGITGRRENLLNETAAAQPDALVASAFDADDVEALPRRLDELAARLGGLDLMVISAGCGFLNDDLSPERELRTIATNVAAFTAAAVWSYTYFSRQSYGHLAALTSVAGLVAEGSAPAYPATKAYQLMYLDSLAQRAKREGLNFLLTELRPGPVDTDMLKGEGHFWVSSPQYAAQLAVAAINKGKRLQYISRRWSVIGAILRFRALKK